mgnify:CR=1 FL=1
MFEREALSILKLERGASQDEIKKAYRKLSLEHHPDKGGDSAAFIRVHEAYEARLQPTAGYAAGSGSYELALVVETKTASGHKDVPAAYKAWLGITVLRNEPEW